MKVLAVDDRTEDLYLLQRMLEGKGFEVTAAKNGKEALEKIKASSPDIVISDILMPEMDGYRLLKEVKSSKEFQKIPFVFYTATYTSKKDEEFAYALGASRFIVKPQEPKDFVDMIKKSIKDHKEGILTSAESKLEGEESYYTEYNERLIQKLEDTVVNLESVRNDLKGSRDFLESVVNSIQDGLIFLDSKNKVTLENENGRELSETALKKIKPELESGDCACDLDIYFNERHYDPKCSSVTTPDNKFLGTVILLRDITARKNVEDELNLRVEELEKWQRLTVGREIKMIELKKTVKELEKEIQKLTKNKG
jgi:CheY-like chemotaxis protein